MNRPLSPEPAGRRLLFLVALAAGLAALACHKTADAPAAATADHDDHQGHHGHDENPDHGHPSGEDEHAGTVGALPLAGLRGITFAAVGEKRRESAFVAAEAVAEENATRLIPAPIAGQVARVAALPGRQVARGELLAVLHSPALAQLRSELLVATAELQRARAEREREERLLAAGATALRDLEAARAAEAVAVAEERAAQQALAVRGLPLAGDSAEVAVRSPVAGKVIELTVRAGESVAEAAPLLTLLSGKAALVRLELPLPGPGEWPAGAATEVRRADGQRWNARLEGEPAAISPESRRLVYRFRLEGGELPLPGTPVEVKVPLDSGHVLPQNALQQIEGEWGVFRLTGELGSEASSATFVPVRRGAELGGDVLVFDGIAAGEKVATEGAYLLKALWLKRAGGGGDAHDH